MLAWEMKESSIGNIMMTNDMNWKSIIVVKAFEISNLSVNVIAMNAIIDMRGAAPAYTIEKTLKQSEKRNIVLISLSLAF